MTEKYQNRYRIKSARLQNYDYTNPGLYFITICTKNSENYFGHINDGKMQLSNIGVIANIIWHEIKNHQKNIELHEFVVMPNHIHGVLEIVDEEFQDGNGNVDRRRCMQRLYRTNTTNTTTNKSNVQNITKIRFCGAYYGRI